MTSGCAHSELWMCKGIIRSFNIMSTNLCEGFNTTQQMLDTYRNLRT